MIDPQDLADRIVACFNEPDTKKLGQDITSLWAPDGEHLGGFRGKGYAQLEEGIQGSHDNNVVNKEMKFRAYNAQARDDNLVCFMWDAFSKTGEVQFWGT